MKEANGQQPSDALRDELRDRFEQPALEIRARLEDERRAIVAKLDAVNEQLRMVNAMLRPLGVEPDRPAKPAKSRTAANLTAGQLAKFSRVRDYIEQRYDDMTDEHGTISGESVYHVIRRYEKERNPNPKDRIGKGVVNAAMQQFHAEGWLVADRTVQGGNIAFRIASRVTA